MASVVLILKKGNTSHLENYRPILLLHSIYKLKAAVPQGRLEKGLEKIYRKPRLVSGRIGAQAMPLSGPQGSGVCRGYTTKKLALITRLGEGF